MRHDVVIWLVASCVACGPGAPPSGLIDGMEHYRENRVAAAWPHFARAVVQRPKSPDTHAWLAEAERRLDRFDDATSSARAALSIDSCHAFAHTVLGDAFARRAGAGDADADSAWAHYLAAVDCDPVDGNAHIGAWGQALRRGDRTVELEALRSVVTSGFLTTSVLAFNRWILTAVPDRAVLITNGDFDTFPALGLQTAEGLRPDVAVVNRHMLNQPWYVELVRDRHGLAGPRGAESPVEIVRGWARGVTDGTSDRPIVFARTVDRGFMHDVAPAVLEAGAFFQVVAASDTPPDTAAMRRALEGVRGEDFSGPETSAGDRSAVRMAARHQFGAHVVRAYMRYAEALLAAGRVVEARDALERAERFGIAAGATPAMLSWVRDYAARASG